MIAILALIALVGAARQVIHDFETPPPNFWWIFCFEYKDNFKEYCI
jgi:hypothetical protein